MDIGMKREKSRLDRQYDYLRERYGVDIKVLNRKLREQSRRQYEYEFETHLDARDFDRSPGGYRLGE